jgi:tryptophanyl-tRNA synthetase
MTGAEMRIVSGIQRRGNLHLGNYLGAITRWWRCRSGREQGECLFFLADLHAITCTTIPTRWPPTFAPWPPR